MNVEKNRSKKNISRTFSRLKRDSNKIKLITPGTHTHKEEEDSDKMVSNWNETTKKIVGIPEIMRRLYFKSLAQRRSLNVRSISLFPLCVVRALSAEATQPCCSRLNSPSFIEKRYNQHFISFSSEILLNEMNCGGRIIDALNWLRLNDIKVNSSIFLQRNFFVKSKIKRLTKWECSCQSEHTSNRFGKWFGNFQSIRHAFSSLFK